MNFKTIIPYLQSFFLLTFLVIINTVIYFSLIEVAVVNSNLNIIFLLIGLLDLVCIGLFVFLLKSRSLKVTVKTDNDFSSRHEFLAKATHELRTPLTGILGFITLLKKSKLDEEQHEFLGTIEKSSNTLLSLVNDILDYSKVTAGKIKLETRTFDLLKEVEDTIEGYITKVADKYIELGLYVDPHLPTNLIGDSSKISQVLLNLLSNAIKFTPEHGLVNVRIEKLAETEREMEVSFSVQDSGIGISKDNIEKIFEAFSQAETSTSREYGGTGLGLSISSDFVALMGGKLEIKSFKNKGTTLSFTLKLKKEFVVHERMNLELKHKNIGYVIPRDETTYEPIDINLAQYISKTQAEYRTYYEEEVFALAQNDLPDVLFINHRYSLEDGVLDRLLALNTKVILITCADSEKIMLLYEKSVSNFVFKPINYSKTMNALIFKDDKIEVKKSNLDTNEYSNKVLLVEDNLINQKLLHHLLLNMDMKIDVTLANNGLEALNLYKENEYSMILMDIQMPIMSGITATKEIRAYEKAHDRMHTPIIAITANISQENIEEYLAVGMNGFIGKPINLEKLRICVQEYSGMRTKKKKNILLYKDDQLSSKIYTAILEKLDYEVDACFKRDIFMDKFTNNIYSMILFDTHTFDDNLETSTICNLLSKNSTPSFAFTENSQYEGCSTLIPPYMNGKELEGKLEALSEVA